MTVKDPRDAGKPEKEPGMFSRSIATLEQHFERGEDGKRTGYERPDVEEESEPDPTSLDAGDFQRLTEEFKQHKSETLQEERDTAADRRQERVNDLRERHVDDARWHELLGRARTAARAGETEFELLRFPSQLCSDGGRAINVTEDGWPDTLRGEANELYQRWERDLKPQGFRLKAKILDFPGGFPGDAGLFLAWTR